MIKVAIVDDSALSRAILKRILEADGDIAVVGEAANGFEAIPCIERTKPDLVTMDIDMPGPSGLETIERIMHAVPVPILVVTGEHLGPETDLGFRAIQNGALDFMAKPTITDQASAARLRAQVRTLATAPVFLHTEERISTSRIAAPPPSERATSYAVVAIASGTGGPRSLARILSALPRDFGCAILVVQQLPDRFDRAFSKFLQSSTSLPVVRVETTPMDLDPGRILLSGGDAHLFVPQRGVVIGSDAPPYGGVRPSATVLLRSVAETYGSEAIGIVLSGTGDDGLEGISALRDAGGLTLAESPSSALVAELPTAALKRGAIKRAMPAELLADYLVAAVSKARSKTTAPPSQT